MSSFYYAYYLRIVLCTKVQIPLVDSNPFVCITFNTFCHLCVPYNPFLKHQKSTTFSLFFIFILFILLIFFSFFNSEFTSTGESRTLLNIYLYSSLFFSYVLWESRSLNTLNSYNEIRKEPVFVSAYWSIKWFGQQITIKWRIFRSKYFNFRTVYQCFLKNWK